MEKQFIILNFERIIYGHNLMFWNQNQHGYTDDLSVAGIFSEKAIKRIDPDPKKNIVLELKDEPNEIGLTKYHILNSKFFINSSIKVVLNSQSDLSGLPLEMVVSELSEQQNKKECK